MNLGMGLHRIAHHLAVIHGNQAALRLARVNVFNQVMTLARRLPENQLLPGRHRMNHTL